MTNYLYTRRGRQICGPRMRQSNVPTVAILLVLKLFLKTFPSSFSIVAALSPDILAFSSVAALKQNILFCLFHMSMAGYSSI